MDNYEPNLPVSLPIWFSVSECPSFCHPVSLPFYIMLSRMNAIFQGIQFGDDEEDDASPGASTAAAASSSSSSKQQAQAASADREGAAEALSAERSQLLQVRNLASCAKKLWEHTVLCGTAHVLRVVFKLCICARPGLKRMLSKPWLVFHYA